MTRRDRDTALFIFCVIGTLTLISHISTYATSDARICERALKASGEDKWRALNRPLEVRRWCDAHKHDWRRVVWRRTLQRVTE